MSGDLEPLQQYQQIVKDDGTPTEFFIRWAQQRQIDIQNGITAAQAQQLIDDWAAARTLVAGAGLTGGGTLAADRTFDVGAGTGISVAANAVNLADTAVTPGTYGDASNVPQITVDQQGRITDVVDVAISGGGGSAAWTLVDQTGAAIVARTVTITIATPGVVSLTAHGFANDTAVIFSTTGALPTGLTAGTTYYTRNVAANTFEVSATVGGASINTTGTQSGVHSVIKAATWNFSAAVGNVGITGLSSYTDVLIIARSVTKSVATPLVLQVSVDNGSSYYSTSGDYILTSTAGAESNQSHFGQIIPGAITAARTGTISVFGMKVSGVPKMSQQTVANNGAHFLVASLLAINAIRAIPTGGGNLTGGQIFVMAR